ARASSARFAPLPPAVATSVFARPSNHRTYDSAGWASFAVAPARGCSCNVASARSGSVATEACTCSSSWVLSDMRCSPFALPRVTLRAPVPITRRGLVARISTQLHADAVSNRAHAAHALHRFARRAFARQVRDAPVQCYHSMHDAHCDLRSAASECPPELFPYVRSELFVGLHGVLPLLGGPSVRTQCWCSTSQWLSGDDRAAVRYFRIRRSALVAEHRTSCADLPDRQRTPAAYFRSKRITLRSGGGMYSRILVPLDGSTNAEHALPAA